MKIAVFGCAHGMLNRMYQEVDKYERDNNVNIDFIIVCGDCQTLRHRDDLKCINVNQKYLQLGDFPDYYSGKKRVPKLTMFVGGNHEASNYLMTLPYGGWVCENFYYLGYSNVINYKGLRIAGISGIFNYHNSSLGHFEQLPFNPNTIRSIYHTRKFDIFKLQLLVKNIQKKPIDIFLSHDWPAKIYEHGDKEQLLRFKPFFKEDMDKKQGLGNPLTQPLVYQLQPKYWLAAHLHCKFEATVKHNSDDMTTKFLSLNKIGDKKKFMEIIEVADIDHDDDEIHYDPEWIAVIRKTNQLDTRLEKNDSYPSPEDIEFNGYIPSEADIVNCKDMLVQKLGSTVVPRNFSMSEPIIYDRDNGNASSDPTMSKNIDNPQTEEFLKLIDVIPLALKPSNMSCRSGDMTERNLSNKRPYPVELDEDGCLPFTLDTNPDF